MLIILLGILSIARMVVDIFPVINIPVVVVVWNYPGLSAADLAQKPADEANENLAFAEGRYSAGVGNIIELTDAELLAATTQSQLVEARYAYQVAVGRLQVATGKDSQH